MGINGGDGGNVCKRGEDCDIVASGISGLFIAPDEDKFGVLVLAFFLAVYEYQFIWER